MDEVQNESMAVLEAVTGESTTQDYVSISGSPESVVRLLRLLIDWHDHEDDGEE